VKDGKPASLGGWRAPIEDLERRRDDARAMGGADKIARQHATGRLTARERVLGLCDEESFVELGALVGSAAGVPADGFIAGAGRVGGRDVLVGAEDFTVMGGSIGIRAHAKRHRLAELAAQERVPLVMMLDGAGERAQNAFERYPRSPNDLQAIAQLSGLVPTVAMILGPSAGHSAVVAPLVDFVVMTESASAFAAGPPLVREATGEVASKEELGGAHVHAAVSGLAHSVARDDQAALALVRRYLSFFPQSAWARPPRDDDAVRGRGSRFADTGERSLDELLDVIPADHRRGYDMRRVLEVVADAGDVLEIQPAYGGALLTALARLGGEPVAIVASQPTTLAGAIDGPAADKAARFIEVADAFHLPVVFLADTPGILVGKAAERDGILRRAMRMFAAQSRIRGVKIHVTLRKVYGVASCLMGMNPFDRQTMSLALPIGRLGAMPASGAGEAAKADADLQGQLAASEMGGVYGPADSGSYDDVIDPRELRNRLLHALRLARHRVDTTAPAPACRTGIAP
jgi:acetyl-CoA carboxylase carboxyltransferase component